MNRMLNHRWNRKNEGVLPMMAAADSLVHFMDDGAGKGREILEDDGLTAMEVARTAYLCMGNAGC